MSCSMSSVSDIKLIRTDTTLDLSQKAEKRCRKLSSPNRALLASRTRHVGSASLNMHPSSTLHEPTETLTTITAEVLTTITATQSSFQRALLHNARESPGAENKPITTLIFVLSLAYDHITGKTPVLVRSPKLNPVERR